MAEEIVQTRLVDDLDGTSDAAETVTYRVDGATYEIDLSTAHLKEFRSKWEPYIKASRKVAGKKSAARAVARIGTRSRQPARKALPAGQEVIRAWAKSKRIKVSDRGRIPDAVIKQYEKAQKAS